MLEHRDPALPPRRAFRIGVTGHRPNKLDNVQQAQIRTSANALLACLSEAARNAGDRHLGVQQGSDAVDLHLVTSLAEGADTIFAESGCEAGYRLDVVLPFPRQAYVRLQHFSADAEARFKDLLTASSINSLMELDHDASDRDSARLGYLAAGRRVIDYSDILIAVWNGEREDGVGGTAQILREALDRGVPVVWMRPNGNTELLIEPRNLSSGVHGLEMLTPEGKCSSELSKLVHKLLVLPKANSVKSSRHFGQLGR